MIAEQKARVLAEKQVENVSRGRQKQGNIEKHSSNQCREFSSNSTKGKTAHLQQKRKPELAKPSTKDVHGKVLIGQVTTESSDVCECSQEHLQCCGFIIDPVGDSTSQNDDRGGPAEHSTKYAQQYRSETVESSGLLQQKECKNTAKLHKELSLKCECGNDRTEHMTSHLQHSHTRSHVSGSQEQREYRGNHPRDPMEPRRQCDVRNRLTDHDMKMHPEREINDDRVSVVTQSQHCNSAAGQEASQLRQVRQENNEEGTDILQQASESLTSLFIKPSGDVTPNVSHVGGSAASARGDEGHHNLMLPRASKRSVSPGSDEGCSVALPPECNLTPCSSEDDIVKRLVEKSTARWTWPPVNNDQDIELQGPVHRHEYGRCGSSDSAVCLLPSDDERRLQLKDPGIYLRQTSTDSNIVDFVTSEDTSCEKAMVFDRYVDKASDVSFDLVNLQYIWRHGPSSKESRREFDIFPDTFSRRNSGDNGDIWFEEMRDNAKETECDDVCDSGIDREAFLVSAGESCWDLGSAEGRTGVGDDRCQATSPTNNGYPCSYRPKQFRKLRSMISCESGVVEDEDCSRKSSTTEGVENPDDDDGYLVELRRQSAQSFQTDDEESSANSQYRYWRTPSVVVSDYSDDVPYFTSVTLEELEQLQDASSSECASGTSSVSGNGGVSALDTEYALRTPERKASDCSTCSTLSGDEDASCDALLQPVRTRQKVGQQVCYFCILYSIRPFLMWPVLVK
jgi:hypothetical protein